MRWLSLIVLATILTGCNQLARITDPSYYDAETHYGWLNRTSDAYRPIVADKDVSEVIGPNGNITFVFVTPVRDYSGTSHNYLRGQAVVSARNLRTGTSLDQVTCPAGDGVTVAVVIQPPYYAGGNPYLSCQSTTYDRIPVVLDSLARLP